MPIVLMLIGIFAGTAAPATLGAVSIIQWVAVAENVAGLAPAAKLIVQGLHPVFDALLKGLANGDPGHAAVMAQRAAKNWIAENGDYVTKEYSNNAIA